MIFKGIDTDKFKDIRGWEVLTDDVKEFLDLDMLKEVPKVLTRRLVTLEHLTSTKPVGFNYKEREDFKLYYAEMIKHQAVKVGDIPSIPLPILIDKQFNIVSGHEWYNLLSTFPFRECVVFVIDAILPELEQQGKTVYEYEDRYALLKNPEKVYDILGFDENMKDIIYKFNKNGLSTRYCCAGHRERDSLYILFNPSSDGANRYLKEMSYHIYQNGYQVQFSSETDFNCGTLDLAPYLRVFYTKNEDSNEIIKLMSDYLDDRKYNQLVAI